MLYCSRCGSRLPALTEEGQARLVCPACGHVSYRQLKVGAGLLVVRDGALLLARRGPGSDAFAGTWNLPAGYCEDGERPQVTAAREAAEETGLAVEVGRLVDAYFFDDDPRGAGVLIVYEGTVAGGALRPDGAESSAAGFFSAEELPSPLCGGGHDRAIRAWQARAQDRWQPGADMRFCPHCAHALEERMAFGRARMACPSCGFVHFREPKVGVSLLAERDDRVLLVRRAVDPGRGLWSLPSGFVEWDEAPEAAAVRECAEETCLNVLSLQLLDASHYTADYRGPGINLTYRAQVAGGNPRSGDDAADARFFAADELPPKDEIAFPGHALALELWRKSRTEPCERP